MNVLTNDNGVEIIFNPDDSIDCKYLESSADDIELERHFENIEELKEILGIDSLDEIDSVDLIDSDEYDDTDDENLTII